MKQLQKPPFFFSISEIKPSVHAPPHAAIYGRWIPGSRPGDNVSFPHVPLHVFSCDGQSFRPYYVTNWPPQGSEHYKSFSIYYAEGHGFWILKGDARNMSTSPGPGPKPDDGEAWRPLKFSYPSDYGFPHDGSAYLCNAGERNALYTQRQDQHWQAVLLPNIYHAQAQNSPRPHGGLQGELAILLGLMALSTNRDWVAEALPRMFTNGSFAILPDGWHAHCKDSKAQPGPLVAVLTFAGEHQRGVVVSVYTCPSNLDPGGVGSTEASLKALEHGRQYGKYFT